MPGMPRHVYAPADALAAMRWGAGFLVHFHPSAKHPAQAAPRAPRPWEAVKQDDGSVLYVHRGRERAAIWWAWRGGLIPGSGPART